MADRCTQCGLRSDDAPNQRCSKCRWASYCSKKCQTDHWPVHKPICRPYSPEEVWAVEILSISDAKKLGVSKDDWERRCRHKLVTKDHPIFTSGEECPVPTRCGLPLVIYSSRLFTGHGLHLEGGGNQPAVYLRIEVDDGFAPIHWQINDPGTCIVIRRDRKPLTLQVIEMVLEFHKVILNAFGYPESDGWAPASEYISKASFEVFSRRYYQSQEEKGRLGFGTFFTPL